MLVRAALSFVFAAVAVAQEAPPPPPTVVVEGRVVDLRGEGVPVAKVTVTSTDENDVLARGVADGEGFFRISRVPPSDWYRVSADSEGHCRGVEYLFGEPAPLRIEVHDAATVRGRLTDRAGEPVAGAIVRAISAMHVLPWVRVDATTDVHGQFELPGVPLGAVQVAAVVAGEGLVVRTHAVVGDTELMLQTGSAPTTTLRLVVTGMPASAVAGLSSTSILPYGESGLVRLPPPWHRPSFAANGVCELTPVPQNWNYVVTPHARGFTFEPSKQRVQAGAEPIVMEFAASPVDRSERQCPARLVDVDGKPMAGVVLWMRGALDPAWAEATTDAAGRATFDVAHGAGDKVIVHAADDRWVLDQKRDELFPDRRGGRAWHQCTLDPKGELELRAVAACSVAGRLLRPDGGPAASVRVALEQSRQDDMPQWMEFAYTTTDRDGRYRCGGLHHLADRVRVVVEGVHGFLAEPAALAEPGTVVTLPELRLQAPATIEGTVVDAQQQPAPGVRVWLREWDLAADQERHGRLFEVVTDHLGRYRFVGVPPGGARLQVMSADEHEELVVDPFAVEAGRTCVHDLTLSAVDAR